MRTNTIVYSPASKIFHWVTALIVIVLLCVSFFLGDFPESYKPTAYLIHKSLGLTVLFIAFIRIAWLLNKGRPPLPTSVPLWQQRLARGVQYSLYSVLIAMPLVGWIMSVAADRTPSYFGLFSLPLPWIAPNKPLAHFLSEVHTILAWVLIGLLVLHIVGALKHYFIDKDNVLQGMLFRKKIKQKSILENPVEDQY